MKHPRSAPLLTVMMLALAAGTATSALAQSPVPPSRERDRDRDRDRDREHEMYAAPTGVDFRSSDWLTDRKVVNDNDEEIASVTDLILDRGSGRIEYVIMTTGETLGMGGRAVAIPYNMLRWESGGEDRFVMATTPERLDQFPAYTPESWEAMKESAADDKSELRRKLNERAASRGDPYSGTLDTAKQARIEGEITKVERVRTSTFGEQVMITVKAADGSVRKIAMGPSWYVNGATAAPMRGDKVVVDTLALPRDPDQLLAGTHLRTGDRELHLRESDGSPAWDQESVESNGRRYSNPFSRYLLLSKLVGMKVDCRGEECGTVHEVILDRNSGEFGFISIDPNENFLGINDTKRLIPWSVATVTLDGVMRIDASKEMVLASPETPDDLSTLNRGDSAAEVYEAFDVEAPCYDASKPHASGSHDAGNAWSARGPIIRGIESDSGKAWSGKIVDVSDVMFEKGTPSARAVRIKSPGADGVEEVVLLGPVSFMDEQKPGYKVGDSIKVDACRTTIDGRRYWIARSVECKDKRMVLLGANNTPAWSKP